MESITSILSRFTISTGYNDIPKDALHDAKRIILDNLGCALGGYTLDPSKNFIRTITKLGGTQESTILGDGSLIPSPLAAFVNAKLGNLMDMDDVFYNIGHQSPVVFYPALAIAEKENVSGKDFLVAFTLGFDISSRVVLALGTMFDKEGNRFVPSDITGFGHSIFGGTAAVGRLLHLNLEKMTNALGIAGIYSLAPLSHKSVTNMSMTKYQLDISSLNAVLSALLASEGCTGPQTILDDSIYAKALGKKTFNPSLLLDKLGERWYISETSIKPYPHCRHSHYALDLVKRIMEEKRIDVKDIISIEISGFKNYTVPPWNNPYPSDIFSAQFSVPYAVSLIIHQIPPGPKWFDESLLNDKKILEIARKVRFIPNLEIIKSMKNSYPLPIRKVPTTVRIICRSETFEAKDLFARGDGFAPSHKLSDE
ncbi:MAG: MmgE/PrpD family protein, partial [Thermodesulfobacteriota bacterium]